MINPLLPEPLGLRCCEVRIDSEGIVIRSRVATLTSACPACGRPSSRVHSRYARRLADLPWHGSPVQLRVDVRKFFCDEATCPRRIFAERMPQLAAAHARQTRRLAQALLGIAFACGGESGARLARRLGMPTSPDTLLRRIRRTPLVACGTPRVLGVDDWALRRGQRYGTIVCDLEQHRPVDLLPDRSAETLAVWLARHPGIETISRDRAACYAQGAKLGAPQATQVADRWHLLHNLHEVLVRTLDRRYRHLHAAARDVTRRKRQHRPRAATTNEDRKRLTTGRDPCTNDVRRARRLERYQQIIALRRQGLSQGGIARRLGIHRETVARFIHAGRFPERALRPYARRTDPFVDYLWQRWQEGCQNAAQLARELKSRGFAGSYYSVRRSVARWRRTGSNGTDDPPLAEPAVRAPSPKRMAWLLLKDSDDLVRDDRVFVKVLLQRCPELRTTACLARAFAGMVRDRRADALGEWITRTSEVGVPKQLRTFAVGLKSDYAAVKAALTTDWSNGQVEGQVDRLKLIKRQMYGRAKFDLLRLRVLHIG